MLIPDLTWRRIDWAVTNVAVVAFAVLGVAFGSPTASNVFKFLAWFFYLAPILALFSDSVQAVSRKRGPAVPWRVSLFIDIAIACLLAGHGWFGYAVLVAVGGLSSVAAYGTDSEEGKESLQS